MTTAIQNNLIPEPIVRKLSALIWRARTVVVLRGLMATLATAVVAVLAIMAIDFWVVIFSDWVRWALSMSGLGATVLVALWFILRPLATSFTLTGVARLIEARHPELHERISSTVELLTSKDGPELRGSDELIAALAEEAVADARGVRTSREINFKAAFPYLAAAVLVVAVLASVIAIWPDQADRLFRRALLANVSRVSNTALEITGISAPEIVAWDREGVDYVLPVGQRLHVELTVRDEVVRRAELRTGPLDGGEEAPLAMTRLPDDNGRPRRFAITCPPARRDFRFRIHAGDALTRYYRVRVVEKPSLGRVDLKYEYPAYTRRGVVEQAAAGGEVAAVAGTVVTITARTNKPVAAAEFALGADRLAGERTEGADGSAVCAFRVRIEKGMKTRWSARLTDRYGFRNEPTDFAVRAVADRRPSVNVSVPNTTRLKLRPTDRVPISFRLRDDFGLAAADVRVEIDGTAQTPRALPLPAGEKPVRRHEGRTVLDLAALPLAGARQVTFRLRAADIVPPDLHGPQEGFSELFTIQLDAGAASFTEQVLLAEELHLREVLQDVLKLLLEAKKDSAPLRRIVPKAKDVTPAVAARVDRLRGHLDQADALLRDAIVDAVEGIYTGFSDKLSDLADDHVVKARDLAGQIKITDNRKQRGALADEADFQVDRSIARVKELLKELGVLSDQLMRAMELDDLAARQDELAEALEDLLDPNAAELDPAAQPPADPEDMDLWKKAQEELADKLAEMAKETPGAVESQLREDTQRTKDLLAEARRLANEQRQLQRDTQQATKLEQLQRSLENLARQQKQLAQQAAGMKAARETAKEMSKAAEDIQASKLEEAIEKQKQAEGELDAAADQGADAKQAETLAQRAEQIAKQQDQLAQQAEAAKKALDAAQAKSQAAEKRAAEATKQAADASKQAAEKAPSLQQKQQALAQRAREMRKAAAANPPTAAEANRTQPERSMDEAAKAAGRKDLNQAAAQAKAAHQQADQLAKGLEQASKRAAQAASSAPKDKQAQMQQQAQAASQSSEKARQVSDAQEDLAKQFAAAARQAVAQQAEAQKGSQQAAADRKAADQAAREAQRQTQRLTGQQQSLAKQASQVAQQAAKAGAEAQKAAQQNDPTGEMQEAAREMSASKPPEAARQARAAAEKAGKLAEALREAAGKAPEGAKEQAPQLAQTSQRQAQLRKEAERLLAQKQQLENALLAREMARLQREQAQLAKEAGTLADEVKQDAPQADRLDTQAARQAQQAAADLARRDPAQAAENAAEAGEKLGELAQRLNDEIGRDTPAEPGDSQAGDTQQGQPEQGDAQQGQPEQGDAQQGKASGKPSGEPSGKPSGEPGAVEGSTAQEPDAVGDPSARDAERTAELADTAEGLANRQGQLARQIKALAEGDPAAMLAAKQDALGEQTGELAEDVGRIREHAEELIPEEAARRDAVEADRQLDAAEAAQGQASKALESGKPSQAVGAEQRSAQALSSAASALERLGRQLAAAAAKNRSPEPAPESEDLAEAYESADEAAESAQPSDAQLASEQLSQLAQAAMARARAMGLNIGEMSAEEIAQMLCQPSPSRDSKRGTGAQMTDLTAAQLQKLGIELTDWARLPGKLRDQVLQAAGSQAPEEYRGLIRRYFREVARRGSGGAEK